MPLLTGEVGERVTDIGGSDCRVLEGGQGSAGQGGGWGWGEGTNSPGRRKSKIEM